MIRTTTSNGQYDKFYIATSFTAYSDVRWRACSLDTLLENGNKI